MEAVTSTTAPETPSLMALATLEPPSTSRAWQSAPHPSLPIIATATSDKAVNIYSLTTFRLLNRITGGHKRSVRSVGWRRPISGSSGATVLATGSFDSTVGIWRKEDELENQQSDSLDGGAEIEIRDKPDTNDEEAWAFAVLLTGHDSEVKSLAFSPSNPSLLATCSRDKSVWIWEEVSGAADEDEYETIAVLTEHSGDVKCVAWNYEDDVLASGSYDDTIRLWREVEEEGDWMCVACIDGHTGTVWSVQWESPPIGEGKWNIPKGLPEEYFDDWDNFAGRRGPRIVSCSDDLSIKVWRREHRSGDPERGPLKKNKIPSIIKPSSTTETWVLDNMLPQMHSRSVYSLAWSQQTGLIVSCGGDGSIYVYQEVAKSPKHPSTANGSSEPGGSPMSVDPPADEAQDEVAEEPSKPQHLETEWIVVASIDAAHGDYEINHVCWALRRDKDKRFEGEEIIISTGDDGEVKTWCLPMGV